MICVPATTAQLLFLDVPWEEYINRGNAVGGVEAVANAADLEALEALIAGLGQTHLGGDYVASAQELSGSNVIAKVTANSAETELISYIVQVEDDVYAVWASTAILSDNDI